MKIFNRFHWIWVYILKFSMSILDIYQTANLLVQFWCKQGGQYALYAHYALSYQLIPSKNEQYAHNSHYMQEGCITMTQKPHEGIASAEKNERGRTRTYSQWLKRP
jgi:hypothetical protein